MKTTMNPTTTNEITDPLIEELNHKCAQQEQQIAELSAKVKWFEEQFRLSQQNRFGASSEKTNPDQLEFFDEAEKEAQPALEETTVELGVFVYQFFLYSYFLGEEGSQTYVLNGAKKIVSAAIQHDSVFP